MCELLHQQSRYLSSRQVQHQTESLTEMTPHKLSRSKSVNDVNSNKVESPTQLLSYRLLDENIPQVTPAKPTVRKTRSGSRIGRAVTDVKRKVNKGKRGSMLLIERVNNFLIKLPPRGSPRRRHKTN